MSLKPISKKHRKIGRRLRKARKALRISQSALAEKLGSKQSRISKIEAGTISLDVVQFLSISRALKCTSEDVGEILHGKQRADTQKKDQKKRKTKKKRTKG